MHVASVVWHSHASWITLGMSDVKHASCSINGCIIKTCVYNQWVGPCMGSNDQMGSNYVMVQKYA